jgi:hypothetical protein
MERMNFLIKRQTFYMQIMKTMIQVIKMSVIAKAINPINQTTNKKIKKKLVFFVLVKVATLTEGPL